jgi:hypothetical protein
VSGTFSAAEGDTIDFSALISAAHVGDACHSRKFHPGGFAR